MMFTRALLLSALCVFCANSRHLKKRIDLTYFGECYDFPMSLADMLIKRRCPAYETITGIQDVTSVSVVLNYKKEVMYVYLLRGVDPRGSEVFKCNYTHSSDSIWEFEEPEESENTEEVVVRLPTDDDKPDRSYYNATFKTCNYHC